MALKNYADVQAALNNFVNVAGVTPGQAPHGAFWNSMTYTQFTTGNIPGVPAGPWKVLVVGDSKNSNIIQILSGVGDAFNDFGQMPQPNPPYVPPAGAEQATLIAELSAWIDAGCPDDNSKNTEAGAGIKGEALNAAVTIKEFHVCMGLNACARHDVTGTAVMAGTGNCATVHHYCHTLNDCRGQGFCGGGGSSGAQQTEPGNNLCAGKGSCSTLAALPNYTAGPQWFMNQTAPPMPPVGPTVEPAGPYYGQEVWRVARQLFEVRMYESGRTFVPDGKTIPPGVNVKNCFGPSPQPDGPNPPKA